MSATRLTNSRWAYAFVSTQQYYDFVKDVRDEVQNDLAGDDLKVLDSAGRAWSIVNWTRRAVRMSVASDLMSNTLNVCEQYGHDLVFSSYVGDSSNLCLPWQNRVYSISGQHYHYTFLQQALWPRGGLFHPNCRHTIEPYFEGQTELDNTNPPKIDTIKEKYNKRQEWLKANQNFEKYRDAGKLKQAAGLDYTKEYDLMKKWENRRNAAEYDFTDAAFGLNVGGSGGRLTKPKGSKAIKVGASELEKAQDQLIYTVETEFDTGRVKSGSTYAKRIEADRKRREATKAKFLEQRVKPKPDGYVPLSKRPRYERDAIKSYSDAYGVREEDVNIYWQEYRNDMNAKRRRGTLQGFEDYLITKI